MDKVVLKWGKRFVQYYIFRTLAKALNWLVKTIGGSILSLIAMAIGAVFLWHVGFNYRDQLIVLLNNAVEAWKGLVGS